MKKIFLGFYLSILIVFAIYSYGFIDQNFPIKISQFLFNLVHFQREISTTIYTALIIFLFAFYLFFLWATNIKILKRKELWFIVWMSAFILFFSFPAFSNDIFNYIATAKVAFGYHENPYIVMPIEIPNEPMLPFLHAANKIALYGPAWIMLTAIPHFLGLGNLLLTIYIFKFFIMMFYLGLARLVFQLSNKNIWAVTFLFLNPLIMVETLISGHNDVVMMFFAVLAFYLLQRRKITLSFLSLALAILIKYASVFLLPIYFFVVYRTVLKRKIDWQKVWTLSALSMFAIFLLSPLREEMYPWYFIWVFTFVALVDKISLAHILSIAFSFGLELRVVPYLYTGRWDGITPLVKKIVSFAPPILVLMFYAIHAIQKKI